MTLRLDAYETDWADPDWLPDEIIGLLKSANLCNVQVLDLGALLLPHDVVRTLLAAPNLSSVQRLMVELSRDRGPDPQETVTHLKGRFKYVEWVDHWDSE